MASIPSFQKWFSSPYYQQFSSHKDNQIPPDFIDNLFAKLNLQPGDRVVDTSCGSGQLCNRLAGQGFDVTGIDADPEKINLLLAAGKDNPQFFLHDIRLPFWANYFNLAFNLKDSFGFFRTRREHDDAVRTIAKSLKPTGQLVFDYLNVHFIEDNFTEEETLDLSGITYTIHHRQDELNFYDEVEVRDPNSDETLQFSEQRSKFSLGDFTDMLSFQGMQVQQVYGDYQLNNYDIRKSPRMIVIAGK